MINLYTFFTFLTGLLFSGFGLLAYLRNKKNLPNKIFGLLSLSFAIWSYSWFGMLLIRENSSLALLFAKLLNFGATWLPIFYLHWVFSVLGIHKKRKLMLLSGYLITFVFSFLSFSNLYIKGVHSILFFPFWPTPGPLYKWFLLLGYLLLVGCGAIHLLIFLRKSYGYKKNQIIYIILGSLLGFGGGATNFIFMYELPIVDSPIVLFLGEIFVVLSPLALTYAAITYRLMDIRLIIVRSVVFGLIVFIAASIFSVISTLVTYLFTDMAGVRSSIVSSIVVVILLTIFYQPLRNLIEKATNAFLYKKSYNPDALLAEITVVTSSILDLHNLLASICGTLNDAFHPQKIGVALLNKNKKLEVAHQADFKAGEAEGLVNYPNAVSILYKELKQTPGILVIDEMKTRYENGEFKPISPELLLALYNADIAIILPLYVKEQLIGVLALGNKKSGDPYNHQDLNILRIVAGQAGIAIENARLYDELKDFNVKLEEEVRRKTAQLRKANAELRQLDEAKSEFISIASHQLRTPLTIIKGYISMMQEGSFGPVPPVIMENLEKVYLSNERLIRLVENLLDISRIESGRQDFKWEKIHLEDIAQTVADNLKTTAKVKGLKLFFHKPKKPTPAVTADANKIHEVIMNFIDNAIKYTEKGEINVYVISEPQKKIVTFFVKDTGRGLDKNVKPYLFRKFSRGKGSFTIHTEGIGLGLYVAKMIIDAHHGRIWAESEGRDKGSKFCFSLFTNVDPTKVWGKNQPR